MVNNAIVDSNITQEELEVEHTRLVSDPAYFSHKMFKSVEIGKMFEVYSYQQEIMDAIADQNTTSICVCSSRQIGKSEAVVKAALWWAMTKPKQLVLLISPGIRQSGHLLYRIQADLFNAAFPLDQDIVRSSKSQILLKNGSMIISVPNSISTIRGYAANLIIVDEAAHFPDDKIFYEAIKPMLIRTHGKLVLLSTPLGKRGFFYKSFEKWRDKSKCKSFHYPAITSDGKPICPDMSLADLEREKEAMDEITYRQEYEAEFVDESNAYFPYELILPNIKSYSLSSVGQPGHEYFVGVDWGQAVDSTVIVVVEKLNNSKDNSKDNNKDNSKEQNNSKDNSKEKIDNDNDDSNYEVTTDTIKVVYIKELKNKSYRDAVGFVRKVCEDFNVVQIIADRGSGRAQIDELEELDLPVEGFNFTWQSKTDIFSLMRRKFEKKEIVIPNHTELISQLHSFSYKFSETGRLMLSHKSGGHDDIVDAAALAVFAACERDVGGDSFVARMPSVYSW